jgi:anti-sigma B factor antagonist
VFEQETQSAPDQLGAHLGFGGMVDEPDHGDLVVIDAMRFDDRSVVIVVDGELDLATHDRLETAIAAQLAAGCNRFVVDLGATTFIGSSSMGVLLRGVAALSDDHDAAVVLVTSPGITRRALQVSGVLALFSGYATRAEAVAAVHRPGSLVAAWRSLRPAPPADADE